MMKAFGYAVGQVTLDSLGACSPVRRKRLKLSTFLTIFFISDEAQILACSKEVVVPSTNLEEGFVPTTNLEASVSSTIVFDACDDLSTSASADAPAP